MPKNVESCAIASMSDVWECYRLELIAVEDQIRQNLDSKVALVNTVAAHILNSGGKRIRSEEHTSELQSLTNLVCRLLLEKKKKEQDNHIITAADKQYAL